MFSANKRKSPHKKRHKTLKTVYRLQEIWGDMPKSYRKYQKRSCYHISRYEIPIKIFKQRPEGDILKFSQINREIFHISCPQPDWQTGCRYNLTVVYDFQGSPVTSVLTWCIGTIGRTSILAFTFSPMFFDLFSKVLSITASRNASNRII